MPVFQIGITVSRRQYRDVVVRLEAETLKDAKINASKELRKLFASTDEEVVDSFLNKMKNGDRDWYTYEGSFEDWDVENPSGDDYSDMTSEHAHVSHLNLTKKE